MTSGVLIEIRLAATVCFQNHFEWISFCTCLTGTIDNRARLARLGHLPDWPDRLPSPTRPIGAFARMAPSTTGPDCSIGHETLFWFDAMRGHANWLPRLLWLPDWPDWANCLTDPIGVCPTVPQWLICPTRPIGLARLLPDCY